MADVFTPFIRLDLSSDEPTILCWRWSRLDPCCKEEYLPVTLEGWRACASLWSENWCGNSSSIAELETTVGIQKGIIQTEISPADFEILKRCGNQSITLCLDVESPAGEKKSLGVFRVALGKGRGYGVTPAIKFDDSYIELFNCCDRPDILMSCKLIWGDCPPAAADGNDGDTFIDRSTGFVYGPKEGNKWPDTGYQLFIPQGFVDALEIAATTGIESSGFYTVNATAGSFMISLPEGRPNDVICLQKVAGLNTVTVSAVNAIMGSHGGVLVNGSSFQLASFSVACLRFISGAWRLM